MTTFDPTVTVTQEEANSLALTVADLRLENARLRTEIAHLREYARLA